MDRGLTQKDEATSRTTGDCSPLRSTGSGWPGGRSATGRHRRERPAPRGVYREEDRQGNARGPMVALARAGNADRAAYVSGGASVGPPARPVLVQRGLHVHAVPANRLARSAKCYRPPIRVSRRSSSSATPPEDLTSTSMPPTIPSAVIEKPLLPRRLLPAALGGLRLAMARRRPPPARLSTGPTATRRRSFDGSSLVSGRVLGPATPRRRGRIPRSLGVGRPIRGSSSPRGRRSRAISVGARLSPRRQRKQHQETAPGPARRPHRLLRRRRQSIPRPSRCGGRSARRFKCKFREWRSRGRCRGACGRGRPVAGRRGRGGRGPWRGCP